MESITVGPDGALWFTGFTGISRITTTGAVTEYPLALGSDPNGITVGPDGALWFTEYASNKIGRITTSRAISEYPLPTANSQPWGITTGPDGAVWFTELHGGNIGRVALAPPAAFFTGEVWLGNAVNYLQFPDGNLFGSYNFVASSIRVQVDVVLAVAFDEEPFQSLLRSLQCFAIFCKVSWKGGQRPQMPK